MKVGDIVRTTLSKDRSKPQTITHLKKGFVGFTEKGFMYWVSVDRIRPIKTKRK